MLSCGRKRVHFGSKCVAGGTHSDTALVSGLIWQTQSFCQSSWNAPPIRATFKLYRYLWAGFIVADPVAGYLFTGKLLIYKFLPRILSWDIILFLIMESWRESRVFSAGVVTLIDDFLLSHFQWFSSQCEWRCFPASPAVSCQQRSSKSLTLGLNSQINREPAFIYNDSLSKKTA